MTKPTKITPAMHTWCRALADPIDCRLVKRVHPEYPDMKHYSVEGRHHIPKPTWAMVDKLVAAGLIDWFTRAPLEFQAMLTSAGIAQAAIEDDFKPPPLTGWPFPLAGRTLEQIPD